MIKIPIEVSARHIHLTQADLETLFGQGYELTAEKALSQIGQFAARETAAIITEKGEMDKVRIIGPVRKYSQVEISRTDAFKLGLNPPLRVSGGPAGSPGITIREPEGQKIELKEGVIIAKRHIHANPAEAAQNGLKDGQIVSVKIEGERGLIFNDVAVRVDPTFAWAMHIDTDEGNAAGVGKDPVFGEIIM